MRALYVKMATRVLLVTLLAAGTEPWGKKRANLLVSANAKRSSLQTFSGSIRGHVDEFTEGIAMAGYGLLK